MTLMLFGFPLSVAGAPDIPPPPPPDPDDEGTPCIWPACGPLLLGGFSEQPESRVARTEMESGPAKQRRVRARRMVQRPVAYLYTAERYLGFKAWIDATEGDWFEWLDPADGLVKLARVVGTPGQPAYEGKPYAESPGAPLSWEVSFKIETWG